MTDLSNSMRPAYMVMDEDPALQIVRLKNTGDKPWKDKFNNRPYTMEPGQEIVVPFLALCLWLGHPDAIDHPTDPQRQFRFDEWRRLQTRYGSYDNVGDETIETPLGDIPSWKDSVPSIEVLTMAGDPVITVVDDPEGKHLEPAQQSVTQVELMQSALDRMREQMTAMEERLDQATRASDAQVVADDVRTDQRTEPEARPEPPTRDQDRPPTDGIPEGVPTAPPAVGGADVTVDDPGNKPKVIG